MGTAHGGTSAIGMAQIYGEKDSTLLSLNFRLTLLSSSFVAKKGSGGARWQVKEWYD